MCRRRTARRERVGFGRRRVVGEGHLYVVEDDAVHALTTDGQQVWERPNVGYGLGLPVSAGETLYVGGTVDGRERTVAVADGVVFAATGAGDLLALG